MTEKDVLSGFNYLNAALMREQRRIVPQGGWAVPLGMTLREHVATEVFARMLAFPQSHAPRPIDDIGNFGGVKEVIEDMKKTAF